VGPRFKYWLTQVGSKRARERGCTAGGLGDRLRTPRRSQSRSLHSGGRPRGSGKVSSRRWRTTGVRFFGQGHVPFETPLHLRWTCRGYRGRFERFRYHRYLLSFSAILYLSNDFLSYIPLLHIDDTLITFMVFNKVKESTNHIIYFLRARAKMYMLHLVNFIFFLENRNYIKISLLLILIIYYEKTI